MALPGRPRPIERQLQHRLLAAQQAGPVRYNEATLKVQWNGRNIAEVLQMTVDEASEFFAGEDAVARPLQLLRDIGLGYLRLGQPATELSGGEAQRIKLATELQRSQRGRSLYVPQIRRAESCPASTRNSKEAFFFLIGLEVRQEFAHGSLRDRSRARLALIAGVAGVVLPALVYVLLVGLAGGQGLHGWGAVVGTDTAFMLGDAEIACIGNSRSANKT